MPKILILCTGNSCRSQMAEAFLVSFNPDLEVYSAGTKPSNNIHLKTIEVMKELGFDLSRNVTKNVNDFLKISFDYVITVCDESKESCPVFIGKVKNRLHIGFDDPAKIKGDEKYILNEFRRVRDEIKLRFYDFYVRQLKNQLLN